MEAFENTNEDLTLDIPAATASNMTVEEIRRLYESMQSQGVPLVDNQTGRPLTDLIPNKRVLALSQHGDLVWNACQFVLAWLIECGDAELQAKAIKTRAYWQTEQQWVVDWCNNHMYFHWVELALKSVKTYRQALAMFPSEAGSVEASVRQLALMFAEAYTKPTGLKFKRMVRRGKYKGKKTKH